MVEQIKLNKNSIYFFDAQFIISDDLTVIPNED